MQLSLNSRQKSALAMIFASSDFLKQAAATEDRHVPKPVKTALKHASTWATKAWESWITACDDKSQRGVVNLVKDYELSIVAKRTADVGAKEIQEIMTGIEFVKRFAEDSMNAHCKSCDGSIRDRCPVYEGFVHFEIAPYDAEHPKCVYSYVGVES